MRTGCHATLKRSGNTFRFDVWIESDTAQGRLDALGPFNTPLATVLWSDTAWTTWLPGQGTLLRGSGPTLNLPVLDLRNIQPSQLVAPLLARTLVPSRSVRALPPVHGQVAILPLVQDPGWCLLLDQKTGLPVRRQTLVQGKEIEGITYSGWKDHDGVLIPGKIVRTTPDGQILEFSVFQWERLDSIPSSHTILNLPDVLDTITIGQQGNGRKVFRIHAGSGNDSAEMMLPSFGGFSPAPEDTTDVPSDSTSDSLDEDEAPISSQPSSHLASPPSKHF